MSRPNSK